MSKHACRIVAALTLCWTAAAWGQVPTTVQLPSYSSFGVSTTVSAPDRGRMSLGGVGRSSSGSTAFGPALGPGSRSFGRQTSAASADVRATIHDFEAMDRQLLGQAKGTDATDRRKLRSAAGGGSSAERAPAGSVADARRQHAAEVEAQDHKALEYVRQAKRAAARDKPKVAKVLYEMAERRASPELKAQIRRELSTLKSPGGEKAETLTLSRPESNR